VKTSSFLSSSSSSPSLEEVIPFFPQETTLVQKSSLLSWIPTKRFDFLHHSLVDINPRLQQNKVGKFLKENISLNNDDPIDKNDPDINEQHYELLPLDSYNADNDEKDLYQPRYYYPNQEEEIFF
jgi:hypothetical protein